jgi:hypothetical protein
MIGDTCVMLIRKLQVAKEGKPKGGTKAQAKLVRGMSDKQLEEQRKQLAEQEAQLAHVILIVLELSVWYDSYMFSYLQYFIPNPHEQSVRRDRPLTLYYLIQAENMREEEKQRALDEVRQREEALEKERK